MKKFLSLLFTLCLSFSLCFAFTSCTVTDSENSNPQQALLTDLFKCEVGDELPVNPDKAFNCIVSEDCTIENLVIKAYLIEKNVISEGSTVNVGRYNAFVIEIRAEGTVVGNKARLDNCYLGVHISPSSTDWASIKGEVIGDKIIFTDTYEYMNNSHLGAFNFSGITVN